MLLISCKKKEFQIKVEDVPVSSVAELDGVKALAHVKYLASDELEGRAVGTKGGELARTYIVNEFKQMGLIPELQEFNLSSTKGFNVITKIKGSEKSDKIMVITAHYDHLEKKEVKEAVEGIDLIYNGADDNASGVGALLEMARYFVNNKPKHTMIFIATDGEEEGLVGAKHFVATFSEIDNVIMNLNMDMIGRNTEKALNICGLRYTKALRPFFENRLDVPNMKITLGHDGEDDLANWTESSDHEAFYKKDIPFLYFGVEDHKDYHKVSDEFKHIDKTFYVNASNFILNVVIDLDKALQ